jgi:hypothetical protein
LCLILVCCKSIVTTYLCAVNLLLLRIVCISVVLDTFAYHEVCISRSVYLLCLILVRCKSIVTTYSLLFDCVIVFDCTFTTGSAYPCYVCVAYPLIQQILLSFFVLFYDVLLLQQILFCLSCYVCACCLSIYYNKSWVFWLFVHIPTYIRTLFPWSPEDFPPWDLMIAHLVIFFGSCRSGRRRPRPRKCRLSVAKRKKEKKDFITKQCPWGVLGAVR